MSKLKENVEYSIKKIYWMYIITCNKIKLNKCLGELNDMSAEFQSQGLILTTEIDILQCMQCGLCIGMRQY